MRANAVVVGVDGSDRSNDAVVWAADEASTRQARLLVVHAIDVNGVAPWTTTRGLRDDLRAMLQPVVDRAVALAQDRHPDLVVEGKALIGSPIRTLLTMSKGVELVVVGRNGLGAFARAWLGNVPERVLAHAECTAVAVGTAPATGRDHIARIVVGCAEDDIDDSVLRFGFELAHQRRVPLVAVHAVHQPAGIVLPGEPAHTYADAVIDADKRLTKELDDWNLRYSDVRVTRIARTGKAAEILTEVSGPDDLIVVGHHHHAPLSFRQLGCNAGAILHSATCSVAVVHVGNADASADD